MLMRGKPQFPQNLKLLCIGPPRIHLDGAFKARFSDFQFSEHWFQQRLEIFRRKKSRRAAANMHLPNGSALRIRHLG